MSLGCLRDKTFSNALTTGSLAMQLLMGHPMIRREKKFRTTAMDKHLSCARI